MTIQKTFSNQSCYRLIPSKFPPIYLFEDVASPEEFEALYAIQQITNPRIQDHIGNIDLVPLEERPFGITGSGFVMAAFTHINPNGSRFSNGDYGIYYCSASVNTAIAETMHHRSLFLRYTCEPPQEIDMRCLSATFDADLEDITGFCRDSHPLYSKESYSVSQVYGSEIKRNKNDGILYHSVRAEGENFALFKPNLVHHCHQSSHYAYVWDGKAISKVYEKRECIAPSF